VCSVLINRMKLLVKIQFFFDLQSFSRLILWKTFLLFGYSMFHYCLFQRKKKDQNLIYLNRHLIFNSAACIIFHVKSIINLIISMNLEKPNNYF